MVPNQDGVRFETAPQLRVLIVEDHADAADSLALLLHVWGYNARVARSGFEALGLARDYRPDVALIDLMLPGMDGYEVARAMAKQTELRETLLVALTGFGDDAHRCQSRDAGS